MIKIRKYVGKNGKAPFDEWFEKLDGSLRARVRARIKRIEQTGNLGVYKAIGLICELKFSVGGGVRVYFAQEENNLILLLVGGNKSKQRVDIKRAMEYWEDYNA